MKNKTIKLFNFDSILTQCEILYMEAMDGFEPSTQGFADLRLTRFDYIAILASLIRFNLLIRCQHNSAITQCRKFVSHDTSMVEPLGFEPRTRRASTCRSTN